MVVGFTTTCAIGAYHHKKLWVRTPFMVRCTRYNIMWYSLSVTCGRSVVFLGYILVSSSNKTDRHVITEILLKVVFNTIIITLTLHMICPLILYYSCWRYEGVKMGLKLAKFRILIMSSPVFLLYILYEISLPCFSVGVLSSPYGFQGKNGEGANTLNDC